MASFARQLGWRAEALGWDGYTAGFRAMGLDRASAAGAAIGKTIGPRLAHDHIARVNMQIAFPQAHPREIDRLMAAMWDNTGRLIGEFPNSHRFDLSGRSDHLKIEGLDILDTVAREGTPAVFISGHFANWELMGAVLTHALPACRVTYRHANNPLIDRRIIDQRAAYGVKIFAPKGEMGAKAVMQALKDGDSVALLNDQKMNDGIAAPLFGREAMTASGPARMALRFGAPIIPMSIARRGGPNFTVTIHEPLPRPEAEDRAEAVLETVTRINRFVEAWVNAHPEQWFWVHRRFEKPLYKTNSG